jgi:hypothetical protein
MMATGRFVIRHFPDTEKKTRTEPEAGRRFVCR